MRSRALRVTLTLLAVAGIGAAAWFSWAAHARLETTLRTASTFNDTRQAALRHAYELQAAQQAYVAAGQNTAFWFDRVTGTADRLRSQLPELRAATQSGTAAAALTDAASALEQFEQIDKRVRGYASSGQLLLAADIIFSDGLETAGAIVTGLERAGDEHARGLADARTAALREQVTVVAAAAIGVLLVLLLLMPVPRAVESGAVAATSAPVRVDDERDDAGLSLRPTAPEPRPTSTPAAADPPPAAEPSRAQEPSVELEMLAAVCTDIARLSDTTGIPAILERSAEALDATGLVLWLVDASRSELTPIAAHGYSASVLARLGALPVGAKNATAAAFRTGLLQTVSADGDASGAIAAPLVSPAGCLGVMAAEVRHDAERHPDRLAAASIVAAQLATIIGPPAAEDRSQAVL